MTQRCPIDTLYFLFGERRQIYLSVRMGNSQNFLVTDATFELLTGGEVEDRGACETVKREDGSYVLSVLLQPASHGWYTLFFTYHLGEEIRKAEVSINVS